jgi:hypothetical protein
MAYSLIAKERRRCASMRKDGQLCRAYALWDDPLQRCLCHAGRHHHGPQKRRYSASRRPNRYTPCMCAAYNWPHRPGGGLCRWPEEPTCYRNTPAGTHAWPRLRPERYIRGR